MTKLDDFLRGEDPALQPAPGTPFPARETPSGGELVAAPEGTTFTAETSPQEFYSAETVTPSGIEIRYSAGTKHLGGTTRRMYEIRSPVRPDGSHNFDWFEVPSVTSVLDVLNKPGLPWWGMKVGVVGVLTLVEQNKLDILPGRDCVYLKDAVVGFLTQEKLTVNHVRDKAGDRGQSVHDALEKFACEGIVPVSSVYPETERGYIDGLLSFLMESRFVPTEAEIMVGSLAERFAGRYDLGAMLHSDTEMAIHHTPKRGAVRAVLPKGFYRLDLKSSKSIYATHHLQLEGYEGAAVECGYEPSNARAVVHVDAEGRYRVVVNPGYTYQDFLAIRRACDVISRKFSLA